MKSMRGFYLNTTLKNLSKTSSNAPYKFRIDLKSVAIGIIHLSLFSDSAASAASAVQSFKNNRKQYYSFYLKVKENSQRSPQFLFLQ